MADMALTFEDSDWRPTFGGGVGLYARERLTPSPFWHFGTQYRLNVIELLPFVRARVFGELSPSVRHRVAASVGIERVYQSDWLISIEGGPTVDIVSEPSCGAIILLGLGYQYRLNQLY